LLAGLLTLLGLANWPFTYAERDRVDDSLMGDYDFDLEAFETIDLPSHAEVEYAGFPWRYFRSGRYSDWAEPWGSDYPCRHWSWAALLGNGGIAVLLLVMVGWCWEVRQRSGRRLWQVTLADCTAAAVFLGLSLGWWQSLETRCRREELIWSQSHSCHRTVAWRAPWFVPRSCLPLAARFQRVVKAVSCSDPSPETRALIAGLQDVESLSIRGGMREPDAWCFLRQLPQLRCLAIRDLPTGAAAIPHAAALTSLVQLRFANVPVTDDDLPALRQFPDLRVLDLRRTAITGAGLTRLRELEQLRALYLPRHLLDKPELAALRGHPNLLFLNPGIGDEADRPVEELVLTDLPRLREVYLPSRLRRLRLERLPALEGVLSSPESLRGQEPDWVFQMSESLTVEEFTAIDLPVLQSLTICTRELRKMELSRLPRLQRLELIDAPYAQSGVMQAYKLPKSALRRTGPGFDLPESWLRQIGELHSLRELHLHGARVCDDHFRLLSGLTNLEEVCFFRSSVSDLALEHFRSWKNLRSLDVTDTRISSDAMRRTAGPLGKAVSEQ
jgi:hypothetical protein